MQAHTLITHSRRRNLRDTLLVMLPNHYVKGDLKHLYHLLIIRNFFHLCPPPPSCSQLPSHSIISELNLPLNRILSKIPKEMNAIFIKTCRQSPIAAYYVGILGGTILLIK